VAGLPRCIPHQKITGIQQGNGRYLSTLEKLHQFNPPLLKVKHDIRAVALGKHGLVLF